MNRVKKLPDESIPFERIESIFHQVMELPESERASEIKRLADGSLELATEVESLVSSAVACSDFLESRDELRSAMITQILSAWSSPQAIQRSGVERGTTVQSFNDDTAEPPSPVKVDYLTACEFLARHRPELQVIEQVGEGAAGIVLRAHDRRLDRLVAVKLLHPNWASRLGEDYLEREAQAASLTCDHVVRVYEVAPPGAEIHYLMLEWISGPSLRDWLSEHSALPPRVAARLALQVSQGLASVHQHGFIHGDIKPANVMLEPQTPASGDRRDLHLHSQLELDSIELGLCRAKLADFGLARRLDRSLGLAAELPSNSQLSQGNGLETDPSVHFMGTPAYASPEQLIGGQPSHVASDLWSVGATLYHCLVGTPPFSGHPHAIIRQMSHGDFKALRALDPKIPKDLESICLKALARLPEQRYANAALLAEDLQRFLNGQPVLARPISAPQRLFRLIRQRPLISSLIFLLGLALLSGTIVSNAFRIRAEKNFALAATNLQKAAAERDRAKAVVELLQGMISAADVNYGDRDVKMVDALAGLESRMAEQLANLPELEADVSHTLAQLYFSIADYEKSRRHFERAIELRGSQRMSPELLEDRVGLANTLRWLYLPDQALEWSQENWTYAQQLLAEEDPISLYAGEVLAGCYHDLGKYSEAETLFLRVLDKASQSLGDSHEKTLQIRSGFASLLTSMGRFAEAERELQQVQRLQEAAGNVSNRESLIVGSNLAMLLAELGRLDEAVEQQQRNATLSASLLGEFHDSTITAKLNLAESLRRADRTEESLALCRQLLEDCSQSLGWTNNGTLGALESVLLMLVRQKDHAQALELLSNAENRLHSTLDPESDWGVRLASCRAAALSGLGDHDQAAPLYLHAMKHYETKYGRSHVYTLTLMNNYSVSLIEANRGSEAAALLKALLDEIEDKFDSMRPVALRNLGHAMLSQGDVNSARKFLEQALELSQSRGELENVRRCQQLIAKCQEGG